jgi:hypothetical protein
MCQLYAAVYPHPISILPSACSTVCSLYRHHLKRRLCPNLSLTR